jgi:uncharacterized membrane protein
MHPVRRFAHHRPRLVAGIAAGAAAAFAAPSEWQWTTSALAAWNVGVWTYLAAVGWLVMRADHARVRIIAEQEDNSAAAVLVILSVASVFSLAAIVLELAASKGLPTGARLGHFAFTGVTVLGSWLMVGVLFTFHYARMFYMAPADRRPLAFPDRLAHPEYWDFLYFSFTIAVAAQTSDVAVLSTPMRRVALAQSILSFLFNVAILGLSMNIAAGLIGA